MRIPDPEPGLVIRFDFLWKREDERGLDHGMKDRPCAVVLVSKPRKEKARQVVLCPITHMPPEDTSTAVEIPPKVAAHLGLDAFRSWIRTHEVNLVQWEAGRIPPGVLPADRARAVFGFLPPKLYANMRDQVLAQASRNRLKVVNRDGDASD